MVEAARRGFPGSLLPQNMHVHHPSLLSKGRLLGSCEWGGAACSPVKLSSNLCEQMGVSVLALSAPAVHPQLSVAGSAA